MEREEKSFVAAFLDWENLFYSGKNHHGVPPDPEEIVKLVRKYGQIIELKAFAHFDGEIEQTRQWLQAAGIDVIDVPAENGKSYTDFVMLDSVYQTIIDNPSVSHVVLGTGDGHFKGVAARLRNRLGKIVIVVAVPKSIAQLLVASASEVIPLTVTTTSPDLALRLIRFVESGVKQGKIITFTSTCKFYRPASPTEAGMVRPTLQKLLEDGAINRRITEVNGQTVAVIEPNYQHPFTAGALNLPAPVPDEVAP